MRVVHVCLGFPVEYPGGITNYVRSLAASQLAEGMDVHVVSRSPDGPVVGGAVNHSFTGSAIPFDLSVTENRAEAEALTQLLTRIAPDLIHFHMTIDLSVSFFETFPDRAPAPYVVSLHDYYYLCPRIYLMDYRGRTCSGAGETKCAHCVGVLDQVNTLRRLGARLDVPLPRWDSPKVGRRQQAMRHFLGRAFRILAVSSRVRDLYGAFFDPGTIEVLNIGNDSANRPPYDKVPSETLRVTFLGTLNRHKGAEVLARLAAAVTRPDMTVAFYGRADQRWMDRLTPLGVQFLGPYRPEHIPDIMARTDLGMALPIWEDNGPQVVMEFINYGVPVLATRMGGIPDFVNDRNAVLFDPASAEDTARAAHWLQHVSRDTLAEMAAHAQRLLSPADHAAQLRAVYDRA
ncbi:glycosyltransferase [Deinococcus rufus]|uniref:Glycosyltransferase n=1 Tax=Deinococcus rufus TaxID=2136097 RepID=A0ABV7ZDS1_9DEIO